MMYRTLSQDKEGTHKGCNILDFGEHFENGVVKSKLKLT